MWHRELQGRPISESADRLKSENEEAESTRKSVLGRGNGMRRDPEVGKKLKHWRFCPDQVHEDPQGTEFKKGSKKE